MTETETTNDFMLELRRKDSSGKVIETITIHPDGTEETMAGDA